MEKIKVITVLSFKKSTLQSDKMKSSEKIQKRYKEMTISFRSLQLKIVHRMQYANDACPYEFLGEISIIDII